MEKIDLKLLFNIGFLTVMLVPLLPQFFKSIKETINVVFFKKFD